jgi:hypothetical protein
MQRTPPGDLLRAQMTFDHPFFWSFVAYGIMARATERGRQRLLRDLRHPVSCYGVLDMPPDSPLRRLSHLTFKPGVDIADELPRLNGRTKVTVDMVTRNFVHCPTNKITSCFAAGGLCLFDEKQQFREIFGADAERVMYRDTTDMNEKLEYYLAHDRERRETAAYFQDRIVGRHDSTTQLIELIGWVMETRGLSF